MPTRDLATLWATLALGLTTVLGCLQSVVWNGAEAPLLARAVASALDPALLAGAPASSAAAPSASYFSYGRLAIASYGLLWLVGGALKEQLPPRSLWLASASLSVATTGDLLAYWLSESIGPGLRRLGFWFMELPALCALVVCLSGAGLLAYRRGRPGSAWTLALPASLLGVAALQYLPHGILLGSSLAALAASCQPSRPRGIAPA